jgi:phosphoribosyl-AMP cyclohydrolase
MSQASFPTARSTEALEQGNTLAPRFDDNSEALSKTLETGEAWYFSRSRNELWHKGATSGQVQVIEELRIDCDQDAVWLKVWPQGDGGACHTGARSCFYRVVEGGKLVKRP